METGSCEMGSGVDPKEGLADAAGADEADAAGPEEADAGADEGEAPGVVQTPYGDCRA